MRTSLFTFKGGTLFRMMSSVLNQRRQNHYQVICQFPVHMQEIYQHTVAKDVTSTTVVAVQSAQIAIDVISAFGISAEVTAG